VKQKPYEWLLVAATLTMAIATLLAVCHNRQPSYAGHTLSEWLDRYWDDCNAENRCLDCTNSAAFFAIRVIGTNALPTLLRWIADEPAGPNKPLLVLAHRLPRAIVNLRCVKILVDPDPRPFRIGIAFSVLGPEANTAIPELTRILRTRQNTEYAVYEAADALAEIGSAGTPPLLAAAQDTHFRFRVDAIRYLGSMGTNAAAAVPAIIQFLGDPDPELAREAAFALECFGFRNAIQSEDIQKLRPALQSPDALIRLRIAGALARFETERAAAIGVLKQSLLSTNRAVVSETRIALNGLEPSPTVDADAPSP